MIINFKKKVIILALYGLESIRTTYTGNNDINDAIIAITRGEKKKICLSNQLKWVSKLMNVYLIEVKECSLFCIAGVGMIHYSLSCKKKVV